jgi:hypothetical protein
MSKGSQEELTERWTIKEEKDGVVWWMIRGGAFSNKVNDKYPNRLFNTREDAELYSNNVNRSYDRKTQLVKVEYKDGKTY